LHLIVEASLSVFGTGGSSTNGGSYFYDGDGRRVKKVVGTETKIFVYNASGQLVAEYTTTAPTNPQISYLTSDTLGSPRINTNASGQVLARHDYMPFGEEIIGLGNRSSTNGYQADDIRQKFTQKERDIDTGLDYFGARYYAPSLGRFTGADNVAYSKTEDPQTWNQYAYCRNGPLVRIDPDGHNWFFVTRDGKDYWEWYD
jgi:RHS repeat-associated protein